MTDQFLDQSWRHKSPRKNLQIKIIKIVRLYACDSESLADANLLFQNLNFYKVKFDKPTLTFYF